jgi:trimeric autotransporter adhesin
VSAATATFNGIAHTVSFSTANQITMQLSASDLATAGSFAVVVTNPAPGGGNSNSVNVAVNNAAPSITSLSPSSVVAGSAPQTLTINGSNFAAGSAVNYNGVTHPATLVSATQLTIQLSASDVAAAGNFAVTVTNPAPGGGSSNAVNFQVANPSPILGSLSPASLAVGSSAQPLTINGSNFVSGSVVTYNGTAHAASFVSANQLTIQLTTADLATAGSNPVAVTNPAPGGGASLSISFVVVGLNVSPANLSFGSVDDGTTNPAQNGTLTATGGTVTINAPTVSGAGITLVPSGFSFPVTLNAGQSVQYSVSFSPAAGSPGVVNGSAQFTSNVNAVTETISGTGARNVLVTWAASPTAGVTYNVYRCTGSCGTPLSGFTQIKNGIGVLSYTDDDPALISSTTYSYVITAVLSGAESTPSNVTSATVP